MTPTTLSEVPDMLSSMSFPTSDQQQSFVDFVLVQNVVDHIVTQRPDLMNRTQVRTDEPFKQPAVWIDLDSGGGLVFTKVTFDSIIVWTLITPDPDPIKFTSEFTAEEVARRVIEAYDTASAT